MTERHSGHGLVGWRRATRTTPQPYRAAEIATTTVTIGANCHWVTTADQPNGGSMRPPSRGEPTHARGRFSAWSWTPGRHCGGRCGAVACFMILECYDHMCTQILQDHE